MTKLSCFAFFICIFFQALQAQNVEDLQAYEKAIKPGTQLIYDVHAGGKSYQLIITLKKTESEIAFDWKTTEASPKTGSVEITAEAVAKCDALIHNFMAGGDVELDKETSLLISKKIFNDVSTTSMANVKVNGKDDSPTILTNTIAEYNFGLNGNLVALPGWELQGGTEIVYTIQVIESAKFPFINRIDMGWNMQLAEIKSM